MGTCAHAACAYGRSESDLRCSCHHPRHDHRPLGRHGCKLCHCPAYVPHYGTRGLTAQGKTS